jgi:hypothetical protein
MRAARPAAPGTAARRPARRASWVAAGGVVLAAIVVGPVSSAMAGQFAGERFAPVLTSTETVAVDIEAVAVEPADGSDSTFVVTFREGFEPPSDGYRVAVSVGDPTGKRTRWTIAVFGGEVTGSVETGDGSVWEPLGPTVAELDAPGAEASIVAQTADVPPDSALWAEAELPTPAGSFGSLTPYFSFDELEAGSEGSVPTSSWGWVRDVDGNRLEGAVRVPGAPPTVTAVNRALVLTAPDAPPSLLADQPVTATADLVRVLDASSGALVNAGYLLVNRVTGEVQLFQIVDGVTIEEPEGAAAVVPSSAPGATPSPEPPSTRPVSIDLAALVATLDLPDDPSAVAITVDRSFTLADGSVVTTSGAASSVASLEAAGAATAEPAAPPADDIVVPVEEPAEDSFPIVAVLVAVGVAIGAIAVAALLWSKSRERKRHESLVAEGWLDDELALRSPSSSEVAANQPQPEATPRPAQPPPPVLDLDAIDTEAEQGAPTADLAAGNGGHHAEPDVEETGERVASPEVARATQEQALAELEAQFADLIERVDRLGGEDHPSR